MSPLLDLEQQQRYRELGRLRMGEKAISQKSGKEFPKKLLNWRVTSSSRPLLEAIADLYGGEVVPWDDAPQEGENWQVTTESNRLHIALPPGDVLSQYWELWSGGGCKRRCDGFDQLLVARKCSCPKDLNERAEQASAKPPAACKPVTRLGVLLPDVPDIGVWRLESHGYNAAVELHSTYKILQAVLDRGLVVEAFLRIDPRTAKKEGKPISHFTVPVIEFEQTSGQLAETLMLGAGDEVPALAAAPVEPKGFSDAPAPPLHTDEAAGATTAPETGDPGNGSQALPPWIMDLPGEEPDIIDAAREIWVEKGGDPEGLQSLKQLVGMDPATQADLRARIERNREQATPPPEPADAWDPPEGTEEGKLV